MEDGDSWYLDIVFDDKHVHCNGSGYPKNFFRFTTAIGLDSKEDKRAENYYKSMSKNIKVYDLMHEECGYG